MRKLNNIKLFENFDTSIVEKVKKIIDENQYINDKDVREEKLIVSDKWIIYIPKGTMDHIESHMRPSVEIGDAPGSYYTQDWKKGIENVISNSEPVVGDKPPFRTAWTGVDAKVKVGFVTIGHDDNISRGQLDDYKKYTYDRPVRDGKVKETILLKVEDAQETNFLTVVGSKIGEVDGKGVVSLWTTYPDFKDGKIDGKEIPQSRNEFEKNGFYFKCTKEFFDNIPVEKLSESKKLKFIKLFENFVTAEVILEKIKKFLVEKFDIEDNHIYNDSVVKLFGLESENEIENRIEWGELTFNSLIERLKFWIEDWIEDKFPQYDLDISGYNNDTINVLMRHKEDHDDLFSIKLTTGLF